MQDYSQQAALIRDQILDLGALRNLQREGDEHYEHYQQQITELTALLRTLEQHTPQLEDFDRRIQEAQERAEYAQAVADLHMDRLWQWCKRLGLAGLVLVLVALAWSPGPWLPVVGVLLLLAAAGTVVWAVRDRESRYAPVAQARQDWAVAMQQREETLRALSARPMYSDTARG